MRTKITETITNKFRVLWSDCNGLRGGYQDFDTLDQAKDFNNLKIKDNA
tara:strand:+ start:4765 stop:4911 length:147 start_codon:yes stop_codon:yes gene_type:complete